jgi:S-formylglutathione hydrolase FrmB
MLKYTGFLCLIFTIFFACKPTEQEPEKELPGEIIPWVTQRINAPGVQFKTFNSVQAKADVSYHIFLPDVYTQNPQQRFPVLYWLHGTGGGLAGIAPLSAYFNQAMLSGKIPPMLIVFVNGLPEGMYVNSKDGKTPVENVIIQDLIPAVDTNYRTIAEKNGRILEGFSMGGYGAARLGIKYHHLIGGISLLGAGPMQLDFLASGANPLATRQRILDIVYGGDLDYFKAQSPWRLAEQFAAQIRTNLPIRIAIGDQDTVLPANIDFHQHLNSLQIPHTWQLVPQVAHVTFDLLNGMGEGQWAFYRQVFLGEK